MQEERLPLPGEEAEVFVVDLATGDERVVARTCGLEGQMGANLNWGTDDRTLLFNDVDPPTWDVHCVRLDWPTGETFRFGRGIYQTLPDGRNVRVKMAGRFPIHATVGTWCEVPGCVFEDAWFNGGGGTAYVGWQNSWDCLMEDIETLNYRHAPTGQHVRLHEKRVRGGSVA